MFQALLFTIVSLFSFLLGMPLALAEESLSKEFYHSYLPELLLVGDPGNAPDSTGYGAVSESFFLSKYPITVEQWAFFMNAVYVDPEDKNDFRQLYHAGMCNEQNPFSTLQMSCIEEEVDSSKKSHWIYSPRHLKSHFFSSKITNVGSFPITQITPSDAKRYCNWCEHGCPQATTLKEALAVTENGAYDFTDGKKGEAVLGAVYSLPSANLLYKAMYYKAGSLNAGYWKYPMQSDFLTMDSFFSYCGQKRKGANVAVIKYSWLWKPYATYYTDEAPYLTPVGFFSGSLGAYGHYDLGGNVRVWTNDFTITEEGMAFLALGGSWEETEEMLQSSMAGKETFLAGSYTTIGMRIAASSDKTQSDAILQNPSSVLSHQPSRLSHYKSNEISELTSSSEKADSVVSSHSSNLFWGSLGAMAWAQITAYVLEAALNAFFLTNPPALVAMEVGESLLPWLLEKFFPWMWKYVLKSCEPFTLPRNLVNAVLTLFNAASMSTESTMSMKDDSWETIALLSAESIVTMICVEGSGALVEKPVEWLLDCLKINQGANNAEEGWTFVRLFLNVYYIGAGTYWNVDSAIKNYEK